MLAGGWRGRHVARLAFAPDGRSLAASSGDGRLCLWEVPSGRLLGRWSSAGYQVGALHFAADGRLLALGSFLERIRLWDVASGKTIRTFTGHEQGLGPYRRQTNGVVSLALSPDGSLLAAGMNDYSVRLWEVGRSSPCRALEGHRSWPGPLAFSADGKQLVSVATDGTIRLWSTREAREILQRADDRSRQGGLALAPDGREVAVFLNGRTACLWDGGDPAGSSACPQSELPDQSQY
jgi:WD40 repeat protein